MTRNELADKIEAAEGPSQSRKGKAISKMTHAEAVEAICGCAQTVTLLSYQEAIEGYLKLRGMEDAMDS